MTLFQIIGEFENFGESFTYVNSEGATLVAAVKLLVGVLADLPGDSSLVSSHVILNYKLPSARILIADSKDPLGHCSVSSTPALPPLPYTK